jgi:sugar lactone lactonase YvrE
MPRTRITSVTVAASVLACAALLAGCAQGDDDAATAGADTIADTTAAAPLMSIADVGLQTPESVLYDEQADVYIVSNINGAPLDADDNGFISRIRPTGAVESLKWIDGGADGVTLNAPKGMALSGDTLFVADIDSVRAFHRSTGTPLGARGVSGASFLNDLATGPDGTLYVTDTGVDAAFSPTGSDAIHRFGATGSQSFASAPDVAAPNGIVADDNGIIVVGFAGPAVRRIPAGGGAPDSIASLPAGQLDGVVRTGDGTLYVSSWEGQAVYRVTPDGQVSTVVENVEAPADIGWDSRRHRLLIPLFNGNRIEVREVH